MTANVRSLGWLGTGRMGTALAGRLLGAGEQVTVWNRTPAKTAPLVAAGARAVPEITGVGSCDIVFVTVSASADLEAVAVALLAGPSRPGMIVDCSTVLVKLCHNLYLGMLVQALVEVTSLAEKGGTGRAAFLEFLNGTVLASDWVRKRTPDLVARDWTPTFTTELLRKDFDLGLAAARSLEVPLPVAAAVHQLIQSAIGTGLRDADFLSLYDQQARVAALDSEG